MPHRFWDVDLYLQTLQSRCFNTLTTSNDSFWHTGHLENSQNEQAPCTAVALKRVNDLALREMLKATYSSNTSPLAFDSVYRYIIQVPRVFYCVDWAQICTPQSYKAEHQVNVPSRPHNKQLNKNLLSLPQRTVNIKLE